MASTPIDLLDVDEETKVAETIGKDGLTAKEQLDLYGVVLDAKR